MSMPGLIALNTIPQTWANEPHARTAETGGDLVKLLQLLDQQGETDQTEGIRIGRNENLVRIENAALARPQDIRWAIEKDEIVVLLDLSQLFLKNGKGRSLGVTPIVALKVDQVEGGRNQVESGQQGFTALALDHIAHHEVLDPRRRIEDGEYRPSTRRIELVPALEPKQPDAGVRLRIQIEKQHPFACLHQTGGRIHNKRSLADSALIVDETDFACHPVTEGGCNSSQRFSLHLSGQQTPPKQERRCPAHDV